jgi:hypothetical protein
MKIANQDVNRVTTSVNQSQDGYQVNFSVNFDNPHHVTLEKIQAKKAELGDKGFIEWRRGEDRLADNIGAEAKAHFKPRMNSLEERFGTKDRLKGTAYGPDNANDNIELGTSAKSPEDVIKQTRAATYAMLTEVLGASPQEAEQYVKTKIEFPKEMQVLAASMPYPERQPEPMQRAEPVPQPKPEPKLPEPGLLAEKQAMNHEYNSALRKYANELKATWPETDKFAAARDAVDSLVIAASGYGRDTAGGKDASKDKLHHVREELGAIQDPKAKAQVEAFVGVVGDSMDKTNMQRIQDQAKAAPPQPQQEKQEPQAEARPTAPPVKEPAKQEANAPAPKEVKEQKSTITATHKKTGEKFKINITDKEGNAVDRETLEKLMKSPKFTELIKSEEFKEAIDKFRNGDVRRITVKVDQNDVTGARAAPARPTPAVTKGPSGPARAA